MTSLSFADTIQSMFLLAILVALWGVYTEVRKFVNNKRD